VMLNLSKEQLGRGVVTISAGNHAIAAAYAAKAVGTSASGDARSPSKTG